jgi:hypothetical protein
MKTSLEGKTVVGIDVSNGEDALRFRLADGSSIVWDTEGDCCSESWWADGFQLGSLRGATVRTVEQIDLPDYDVEDGRTRQEEDVVYGYRIDTDRGSATLAFRNSSNGYYGGWASVAEDGDRFQWREITENDWRA